MLPLDIRLLGLTALLISCASTRDVPDNLRTLRDKIIAQRRCTNVLKSGFHSKSSDNGGFDYCGDRLADDRIVYLSGRNGELANMDIDCDGVQGGPADDGRCGSSRDTQAVTTFQGTLEAYGTGPRDLDAHLHSYLVFGNEGTKPNWPTFDPRSQGIRPLSVMAVVCNNKLFYGIWGDTNGDDGPMAMIGEASISLATMCFGNQMNGNFGHDVNDVLYIAFVGDDAVPGERGASWNASNPAEFQASISGLGDRLVERIGRGGAGRVREFGWGWFMAGVVASVMLSFF